MAVVNVSSGGSTSAGNDTMSGGAGDDVFEFSYGNGQDVITDFNWGLDQIDFSATDMTLDTLSANPSRPSMAWC